MVSFFVFLILFFLCFVVAISDLVHDVETIFHLFMSNMSGARETAICSFTGITHILEKLSKCC